MVFSLSPDERNVRNQPEEQQANDQPCRKQNESVLVVH
jgi:hypothetical protein